MLKVGVNFHALAALITHAASARQFTWEAHHGLHNSRSRGKGGKQPHRISGVRAIKRAAAKRRNRKG